jgi:hypothetical protein
MQTYLQKVKIFFLKKNTKMVATFVRPGYPEAQEVKTDLLFLFGTFQNLTGIDDELYRFCEDRCCNSPILQNTFFGKEATNYLLPGWSI